MRAFSAVFRSSLVRLILKRLLMAIPLLLIVTALSFILESLAPGNAARAILGLNGTPAEYAHLRRVLGLNLPLYSQYWHWLDPALHGNLGASLFSGQSVVQAIDQRLPVTLSLISGALLLTVIVGVAIGVTSAVRGGLLSRVLDTLALVGLALPTFWVGAFLIVIFAVKLRWFPATGYVPWSQSLSGWFVSLVLPVSALALNGVAAVARQTREAMLDALASEHVRMARANGISDASIIFKHALRSAGIRVVTILGIQAVTLLGGTVLAENVFALPGLGGLIVTAALQHDVPIVQGIVVYFTLIVVLVNLAIDIAYAWLDPRVRVR